MLWKAVGVKTKAIRGAEVRIKGKDNEVGKEAAREANQGPCRAIRQHGTGTCGAVATTTALPETGLSLDLTKGVALAQLNRERAMSPVVRQDRSMGRLGPITPVQARDIGHAVEMYLRTESQRSDMTVLLQALRAVLK